MPFLRSMLLQYDAGRAVTTHDTDGRRKHATNAITGSGGSFAGVARKRDASPTRACSGAANAPRTIGMTSVRQRAHNANRVLQCVARRHGATASVPPRSRWRQQGVTWAKLPTRKAAAAALLTPPSTTATATAAAARGFNDGAVVTTLLGSATWQTGFADGMGRDALFNNPGGVAVDADWTYALIVSVQ